jgi:hypothetical protein
MPQYEWIIIRELRERLMPGQEEKEEFEDLK